MATESQAADRLIDAGNQAEREGRFGQACESYRAAVDAAPLYCRAHLNLAIGLETSGDVEGALQAYQRALALDPADPYVNYNFGKLLASHGARERAAGLLRAALQAKPAFTDAHVVLGDVHEALGDLPAAAAELEAALASQPQHVGALLNYAGILKRQGRIAQAAGCYEKITVLQPEFAEAHWNLGNCVADEGRLEDAIGHFRRALALNPDFVEAKHSLCMITYEQGRQDEAVACLRALVARHPAFANALLSLGKILASQRRLDEAENSLRQAIALEPQLAEAHLHLGHVHRARDQSAAALRCYQKTLSTDAENVEARWSMVMAQLPAVCETDPAEARLAFSRHLDELDQRTGEARLAASVSAVASPPPFYLAYHEEDNRELLRRYGSLCSRIMTSWHSRQPPIESVREQRGGVIRVGVVSAHFQNHSVWNALVKGWFQHMDRARFALEAFYLGAEFDQETHSAQSLAAHFEHGNANLRTWVRAIARRRPDVLIYPEIGMDSMTTKLASLRLAPVQIASWGHPETSGLPTIDYYVSADGLETRHAADHYTERLVLLPNLGCCYSSRQIIPAPAELAGLDSNPSIPMLVCPGTPFKYAPRHDAVFAEIAARLGRCRFVFFTYRIPELSNKLRDRLRAVFREREMDADEFISFVPWQTPAQFRGLMQRAHVFLDSIGFSGFNTAMEAVECGLPIVTREGRFLRGRFASGILKRLGLAELVADTEERYVDIAATICRDAQYRAHLRGRIAAERQRLFDDAAPIRALEDFIESVAMRSSSEA
jgi:predicted O-linked N-acetylglucosamine transferase (SPINDLY family)